MALTRVERERVTDSRQKVQSVTNSLKHVNPNKIPHFEEIEECLEDADKNLAKALQSLPPDDAPDAGCKK